MTINTDADAAEFCAEWIRNGRSYTAAQRYIGFALEGLRRARAISVMYRHSTEDYDAAIAVLEDGLAEATRLAGPAPHQ